MIKVELNNERIRSCNGCGAMRNTYENKCVELLNIALPFSQSVTCLCIPCANELRQGLYQVGTRPKETE